jgi:hypothetical protein
MKLLISSLLISGLALTLSLLISPSQHFAVALSADMLFPYHFLHFIFSDSAPLTDWTLPPATFLYPEYGVIVPAVLLRVSPEFTALFVALMQCTYFLYLAGLFAQRLMPQLSLRSLLMFHSMMLFPLSIEILSGNSSNALFYQVLFLPVHHTGAFLASLHCLYLLQLLDSKLYTQELSDKKRLSLIKSISTPHTGALIGILFLASIGTFSDRIFLTYCTLPILAAQIFSLYVYKKNVILPRTITLVVIGSIVGFIGFIGLSHYAEVLTAPFQNYHSVTQRVYGATLAFSKDLKKNAHFLSGIIVTIVLFFCVFLAFIRTKKSYYLLYATMILSVLFGPLVAGVYAEGAVRYYLAGFFGAWLVIVLTLTVYIEQKKAYSKLCSLLAMLVLGCTLMASIISVYTRWASHLQYRPTLAKCINQLSTEQLLTRGISDYWYARPTTLFTKNEIPMASVDSQFTPFRVLMPNSLFEKSFNFVVINKIDPHKVIARWGKPQKKLYCKQYELWWYESAKTL